MVERAQLTRANFLSDRLGEIERGIALLAEGGVVANVEIRDPEGNLERAVSVMFETPIAVSGLAEALSEQKAAHEVLLRELGVGPLAAPVDNHAARRR